MATIMRLFTGIAIPDEIKARLDELIGTWKRAGSFRWSNAQNFHITTKFIGEWPDERYPEVAARLSQVPVTGPVKVEVRGLGWFPNPHSPRVFWAGIKASPGLADLAWATEQGMAELGIAAEQRAFSPHLTLARIEPRTETLAVKQAVAALPSTEFGSFTANEFHLYRSKLRPGGSQYTILESFPLER
jgi:2'-5' RNA ligase